MGSDVQVRAHLARRAASLIGYPVAYWYVARHASRTKALLLILLVLPFWISYLMRMLGVDQPALTGRLRAPVPGGDGHQQRAVPPRHHLRPEQLPQRAESLP